MNDFTRAVRRAEARFDHTFTDRDALAAAKQMPKWADAGSSDIAITEVDEHGRTQIIWGSEPLTDLGRGATITLSQLADYDTRTGLVTPLEEPKVVLGLEDDLTAQFSLARARRIGEALLDATTEAARLIREAAE